MTIAPLLILARSTEPTNPAEGSIYLDDGTNTTSTDPGWRYYNGAAWEDLGGGGSGDTLPVADTTAVVKGSADATKLLRFEVDGFTTGTTRVATPPDEDFTMVGVATSQTLANKILSQLHLLIGGFKAIFTHAFTADRTVTLPGDADVTLVGLATTQTPTNKTISASSNTLITGAGASKTLSDDVLAVGTDRNIVVSAETGSSDFLIEVTGLSVGETVYLRAAAGHTIAVTHNSGSATVKIILYDNLDALFLDEQNPLKLTLIATDVLAEEARTLTGADRSLSNLNGAGTSIDASLLVFADGAYDLGASAEKWRAGYMNALYLEERSAPSTPDSGDLVLYPKTDSLPYAKNDGGREMYLGPDVADGNQLLDPNDQTWTNLNHGAGTYTEDTTNRRLTIVEDGNGTRQVRGWYAATPSAPYAIRMRIGGWGQDVATGSFLGVGFRENATGELHIIEFATNTTSGSLVFVVGKWNSATSFNSNYIAGTDIHLLPNWIKLEDDNTNRIISVSADGIAWSVIHTIGRTDFLTADGIVFGCVPNTNATYNFNTSLLSYEVL